MRIALALFFIALSTPALSADEVYRWVDRDGVIHYGAQPPQKDAKPVALPQLQTYPARSGQRLLPPPVIDALPKSAAQLQSVRILSPVQDEIFRDPEGGISVAVAVLPALPAGAGVVFYLDGAAKNAKPAASTSTTFNNVERGEHSVTAAVVDASGKELMRAAPVTFHTKPPSAR